MPYFGLRTFCWSQWTDRFPPRLFGAFTLRFGSHLLAELTITLGIISFKTITLWCYQLGKCRYHALRYNLYYPYRKHARRASNMPARCVTRTLAAEQVCGGCVLCVTRTSVAPGTHVGGTAVEVSADIKFAFAGRPNRTATHVGGAPPCAARTCLLRSLRRRSARCSYCTLFNNRCVLSACSCVSQNPHRRRASAVRFSAFRLPNPTQTRRRQVHGGLWPRLNVCNLWRS